MASFFILTFVVSWSMWLLAYVIRDSILSYAFFGIGGFGPMISAATITKVVGGSLKEWAAPDYPMARPSALVSLRARPPDPDLDLHQHRARNPGPGHRHFTVTRPAVDCSRNIPSRVDRWRGP